MSVLCGFIIMANAEDLNACRKREVETNHDSGLIARSYLLFVII
jgi:hypothetical protein